MASQAIFVRMEKLNPSPEVDYRNLLLKYMYLVWQHESVTFVPALSSVNEINASEVDLDKNEVTELQAIESDLFPLIEKHWGK